MLIVKFSIILLLGFVPFLISRWMKQPDKNRSLGKENNQTYLFPIITKIDRNVRIISLRLHKAMRCENSIRKAYIMLLIFILMTILLVDSYATVSATKTIREVAAEHGKNSATTIRTFYEYRKFLTHPVVFVISGLMTCTLAIYRLADKLLLKIHYDYRWFISLFLITLFMTGCSMYCSGRDIVIPELLTVILMAALLYPRHNPVQHPRARRTLTEKTVERFFKYKQVV